jgi:hypothetical protein
MPKVTSELASTPIQDSQSSLSQKKATAKKVKKEPEMYVFRLIKEHEKFHEGSSIFPPRFTIPNKDTVIFNYGTADEPDFRPRQTRYLDGYKSIYIDEQEQNGLVPDNIVNSSRNNITFENGHLTIQSWNKTLYEFLITSNLCEQQQNKMKTINSVYKLLDFSNTDDNIVEFGKKKDRAYDIARNAPLEEMIPHAKYLGISFSHPSTGEERDYDVIREDYKVKALENPETFLLYANNPRLKVLYVVDKGLEKNIITTELVKGQVHWLATKQMIGLIATNKKPVEAITDFALTNEGESFLRTLKAQIGSV